MQNHFGEITPYLTTGDVAGLVQFVKQAFQAEELFRGTGSAGGTHVEVRIGDSKLMLGGGGNWRGTPHTAALHVYLPDVDAVYQRAVEAGAASVMAPREMEYGDREAGVKDAAGNHWYLATHLGARHAPDGFRTVTPFLHVRGADRMMDFLRQAAGAREMSCYRSPEGVIQHAAISIRSSVIELAEVHGEIQPIPFMFHMEVANAGESYEQFLQAGATPLFPPADQPFGVRMAAVQDAFGNSWYLAQSLPGAA
jgi:uncharacterized glyoxalase superfamily protein PhnB